MSETVNNDCESEDVKDNLDSVLECVDVESAGSASSTGAVKRPVSSVLVPVKQKIISLSSVSRDKGSSSVIHVAR